MANQNPKVKTWCFTWNNYDDASIATVEAWADTASRITVSKEVGETGTPHLQGCVTWTDACRLSALKKLSPTAHWVPAKATESAFRYCVKEGSELVVQKSNQKQGKRTDLDAVVDLVKEGESVRAIAMAHGKAFIKYNKGIKALKDMYEVEDEVVEYPIESFNKDPLDDLETWAYLLHGPPGTGKTSYAMAHFKKPLLVSSVEDLRNLEDHDGVVFDDMSFTHRPTEAQTHLVDVKFRRAIHARYANVHMKKGLKRIFTSNKEPDEVFDFSPSLGVDRRCKRVRIDGKLYEEVVEDPGAGAEAPPLQRSEEVVWGDYVVPNL